jgi:hypothetical protein
MYASLACSSALNFSRSTRNVYQSKSEEGEL